MNGWRFFRLEFAMTVGVYLLFVRHWIRIGRLPASSRIIHILLIAFFACISAGGIKVFIRLISGNLLATFSGPNIFALSPTTMCGIAAGYGVLSVIFFFAVYALGRFNRAARRVFLWLVIPMGSVYPLVMGTLVGAAEYLRRWEFVPYGLTTVFTMLAISGFVFYAQVVKSDRCA